MLMWYLSYTTTVRHDFYLVYIYLLGIILKYKKKNNVLYLLYVLNFLFILNKCYNISISSLLDLLLHCDTIFERSCAKSQVIMTIFSDH